MSKAEEKALKAYPIVISQYSDNCKEYDSNESDRLTFIEGYHQAEEDIMKKVYCFLNGYSFIPTYVINELKQAMQDE